MFKLDESITEWRQQLRAAGVKTTNVLDELESHLRDEIEVQVRLGVHDEEAFKIALQRIGQPAALKNEFAKTGRMTRIWMQRFKAIFFRLMGVPLPSPIPFTNSALAILEVGGEQARGFHHDFIGTEHVLLGLLELRTGAVPAVLKRLGVDAKTVRSEIEKIVGSGLRNRNDHLRPFTPRVKRALELASSEATALKQNQIGAEHIFLGLLREGGGVAAIILKKLGIDAQSARSEIQRQLGQDRDIES